MGEARHLERQGTRIVKRAPDWWSRKGFLFHNPFHTLPGLPFPSPLGIRPCLLSSSSMGLIPREERKFQQANFALLQIKCRNIIKRNWLLLWNRLSNERMVRLEFTADSIECIIIILPSLSGSIQDTFQREKWEPERKGIKRKGK